MAKRDIVARAAAALWEAALSHDAGIVLRTVAHEVEGLLDGEDEESHDTFCAPALIAIEQGLAGYERDDANCIVYAACDAASVVGFSSDYGERERLQDREAAFQLRALEAVQATSGGELRRSQFVEIITSRDWLAEFYREFP
jgi:hypothetical protein